MSEDKGKISRRNFFKGAAMGVLGGTALGMGLFSYSPWRKNYLPKVKRKLADIGVCKSVKVTNISETSWFENSVLMGDIKGAGGLLVNQYSYNWPPFGDGTGLGKGTYETGIAKIKHLLPNNLEEAWAITEKLSVSPQNAGGFAALIEVEELNGKKRKFLLDSGWSYKWMDECFKRGRHRPDAEKQGDRGLHHLPRALRPFLGRSGHLQVRPEHHHLHSRKGSIPKGCSICKMPDTRGN